MLVSAVLLTLYFVVGSHLEEKKLAAFHGDIYRRYMQRVPGLIPQGVRRISGWLEAHDGCTSPDALHPASGTNSAVSLPCLAQKCLPMVNVP